MGRRPVTALLVLAAGACMAACGSEADDFSNESPEIRAGASIFEQRCSGCHTLKVTGSEGSSVNVNSREYKDGPNFNQRKESYDQILYAIRNGGFSSGPMPQNIVVGKEAEDVARFLEKYSGLEAARASGPGIQDPSGGTGGLTPEGSGEQGGE
jgi:mono/diheme cytochrome c family protein